MGPGENNGILGRHHKKCEVERTKIDDLVKSHEFNYRWLSKKVHIQGVVFFQERGHTRSMPSVCKNTTTQ